MLPVFRQLMQTDRQRKAAVKIHEDGRKNNAFSF